MPVKKVLIPTLNETLVFDLNEIICLKADGGYTHFYIADKQSKQGWRTVMASHTLKYFERMLAGFDFQRVNRSMIVGINFIKSINRNQTLALHHDCLTCIPLTKRFRKLLLKHFDLSMSVLVSKQTD